MRKAAPTEGTMRTHEDGVKKSILSQVSMAAAVAVLLLTACGAGQPSASATSNVTPAGNSSAATSPQLQALVDGARKESQLTFVWAAELAGGGEAVKEIAQSFNKTYGLNIQVQFTPGPTLSEMSSKLIQEYQAKQTATTDVYVGYASYLLPLIKADALLSEDWLNLGGNVHKSEAVAPNGMGVAIQTSLPGIAYNTKAITGDAVPKSLQDLLKPRYKGHVAAENVGASFDTVGSPELWGEQRTFDYLNQFVKQTSGIIRCNQLERVVSGEFDVFAVDCSQNNAIKLKAAGAPIDFTIASDAPIIIYLYMAVPKTAAHPNAAKLWVDYMESREAQSTLARINSADLHLIDGSKTLELVRGLQDSGVKFVTSDVNFLIRQGDRQAERQATVRKIIQGR